MTEIALNSTPAEAVSSILSASTLDQSPELYRVTREVFADRFAKYGPEIFVIAEAEIPQLRFLNGLPDSVRQEYTCNTCAKFMKDAGSLVFVKDDGTLISAIWDHTRAPAFYAEGVKALEDKAVNGTVINAFRPRDFDERSRAGNLTNVFKGVFGAAEKGGFNHFSIELPEFAMQVGAQYKGTPKTRMNQLYENMHIDAELAVINTAIAMFKSEKLMRKDSYLPWLDWLLEIRTFLDGTKNQKLQNNYIAKKASMAPNGWVEFRNSMIGSLFDMLRKVDRKELSIETVIDAFNEQADPVNFQRAKAEAKEGNILAAAKRLKDLNMENSMRRRWARLSEILPFATWLPKEVADAQAQGVASAGLFDHLLAKHKKEEPTKLDVLVPPTSIPLFRFMRDVLPTAEKIEIYLDRRMRIGGMTTAQFLDAPPIMRWDRLDRRNPFCQFNLVNPVNPAEFGLTPNAWASVRGIFGVCKYFHDPEGRAKDNFLLLQLEGVEKFVMSASALFKETCISELHEFGPTIEQYSNTTPMGEVETADKAVHTGLGEGSRVRVTVGKVTTQYVLGDMSL